MTSDPANSVPIVFESAEPYNTQRIRAAAICCSDGRFGEQCDDFLHHALALPRYDRLVVPGGPANLGDYFAIYREGDALLSQLGFLIEAHGLNRVVLIGHHGCAFYTHKLNVGESGLRQKQFEDLAQAAERIGRLSADLAIDAYFARLIGDRIQFEAVPLESKPDQRPYKRWT